MSTAGSWSDDIELVLNKIRINSLKLSEYHRQTYLSMKSNIKYFRIPVLIFSAINSVFSVGLNSFVQQSTVSVINCLISLICGIIVSVELFLQIQARMDASNMCSKDFYILTIDIFKTLALDRNHRKDDGITFLEEKYAEYCKYKTGSHLLSVRLRDELENIPINRVQIVYKDRKNSPKIDYETERELDEIDDEVEKANKNIFSKYFKIKKRKDLDLTPKTPISPVPSSGNLALLPPITTKMVNFEQSPPTPSINGSDTNSDRPSSDQPLGSDHPPGSDQPPGSEQPPGSDQPQETFEQIAKRTRLVKKFVKVVRKKSPEESGNSDVELGTIN